MTINQDIKFFRPMLSAKLPSAEGEVPTQEQVVADLQKLDWSRGFWASPKIDGIRAVKAPGKGMVSRTLKLIPNLHVQNCLKDPIFDGLDGELVHGDPFDFKNFNDTQSVIMSQDGYPNFTWCIFDDITNPDARFDWRNQQAHNRCVDIYGRAFIHGFSIIHVEQKHVNNIDELLDYEAEQIVMGFEGIMFRDPGCRYKSHPSNRSTFKQQGPIKLKRFVDGEARITGFVELQRNTNEQFRDGLGYAKRSSALAGQVGADTLGKFECIGVNGRFKDVEFECGSGLDDATRDTVWKDKESYLGKLIKYKYQDAGSKNKPRSPIFLGFRNKRDMS